MCRSGWRRVGPGAGPCGRGSRRRRRARPRAATSRRLRAAGGGGTVPGRPPASRPERHPRPRQTAALPDQGGPRAGGASSGRGRSSAFARGAARRKATVPVHERRSRRPTVVACEAIPHTGRRADEPPDRDRHAAAVGTSTTWAEAGLASGGYEVRRDAAAAGLAARAGDVERHVHLRSRAAPTRTWRGPRPCTRVGSPPSTQVEVGRRPAPPRGGKVGAHASRSRSRAFVAPCRGDPAAVCGEEAPDVEPSESLTSPPSRRWPHHWSHG